MRTKPLVIFVPDPLLDEKEAADHLRITITQLRKLCGDLIRPGYSRSELDAWLQQRRDPLTTRRDARSTKCTRRGAR